MFSTCFFCHDIIFTVSTDCNDVLDSPISTTSIGATDGEIGDNFVLLISVYFLLMYIRLDI